MDNIINKISSYNILNHLLPGVVFAIMLRFFTIFNIFTGEIILDLFLFYFVGAIIGRIGSFIKYFFNWTELTIFEKRKDFLKSEKNNGKIKSLVEASNNHRNFAAMFLLLFIALIADFFVKIYNINIFQPWFYAILVIILFFFFCWSYVKQSEIISEDVRSDVNE